MAGVTVEFTLPSALFSVRVHVRFGRASFVVLTFWSHDVYELSFEPEHPNLELRTEPRTRTRKREPGSVNDCIIAQCFA